MRGVQSRAFLHACGRVRSLQGTAKSESNIGIASKEDFKVYLQPPDFLFSKLSVNVADDSFSIALINRTQDFK